MSFSYIYIASYPHVYFNGNIENRFRKTLIQNPVYKVNGKHRYIRFEGMWGWYIVTEVEYMFHYYELFIETMLYSHTCATTKMVSTTVIQIT